MNYEEEISKLNSQISALKKKWNTNKSNKKIKCARCGELSKIKDIDLIDVLYYDNEPLFLNAEGYQHSEYNYNCNSCGVRNRLLFQTPYHLEWSVRRNYNIELHFMMEYRSLFKSCTQESKPLNGSFANNTYLNTRLKNYLSAAKYQQLKPAIEVPK